MGPQLPLDSDSPTLNNLVVEAPFCANNKVENSWNILDCTRCSTDLLLAIHPALPPAEQLLNKPGLLHRLRSEHHLPPPDLSPPKFHVHVGSASSKSRKRGLALFDTGAGLDAISANYARSIPGVHFTPAPAGTTVTLPTGAKVAIQSLVQLTLQIGKNYKAAVTFQVIPQLGYDIVLGMPWAFKYRATFHAEDKTVTFRHCNRDVVLEPSNPVRHSRVYLDPDVLAHANRRGTVPAPSVPNLQPTIERLEAQAAQNQPLPSAPELAALSSTNFELNTGNQFDRYLQKANIPSEDCFALWVDQSDTTPAAASIDSMLAALDSRAVSNRDLIYNYLSNHHHLAALNLSGKEEWSIALHLGKIDAPLHPAALSLFKNVIQKYSHRFRDEAQMDTAFSHEGNLEAKTFHVDLEPGHKPPYRPPNRLSPAEMDELKLQLEKLLAAGVLRPCSSPYGAPVLFAPKKDGGYRMCCDFRALNRITVKDRFNLPHPEDLFNMCKGAKFFTAFDLLNGFNQLPVAEHDQHKLAITTPLGQFCFRNLPFGVCNGPPAFSRYVTQSLAKCKDLLRAHLGTSAATPVPDFVTSFIDDLLIFSATAEDHVHHIAAVLEALTKAGLYIKTSKTQFFKSQISYLGCLVTGSGVSIDPAKSDAIQAWTAPKDAHELRSFLGLCNFFRRFCPSYATVTAPLTDLLGKKKEWQWTSACDAAFQTVKDLITSAPVLAQYDRYAKTLLVTDASKVGVGGVLLQDCGDGQGYRPVAYYSRKMHDAELNYTTREQELLAIRECLRTWRHYCLGIPIQVHTDHKSLEYINTQRNMEGRLLRWFEYLQGYDLKQIKHIPGISNVVADALSRRPDYASEILADKLQSGKHIAALELSAQELSVPISSMPAAIKQAQATDPLCMKIKAHLQTPGLPAADPIAARYALQDDVLVWTANHRARKVVPPALRPALLHDAHDSKVSGHHGIDKTYARLAEYYYWPNIYKDVSTYVASCKACQTYKTRVQRPTGQARPISIPDLPFSEVGVDIVGPLPVTTDGHNALVTFTCYKTRSIIVAPAATAFKDGYPTLSGDQVSDLFFKHVFRHFGLPSALRSDRGSQFQSEFWQELFRLTGTKLHFSTAFHPQTQGLTERANKTVIESLRHYLDHLYEHWHDHLIAIEFAYNSSVHPSLGCSPFEALLGYRPRNPLDLQSADPSSPAGTALHRLQARIDSARDHLLAQQLAQAKYLNKRRSPASYKIGDQVLLDSKNINLTYPSKFCPRFLGPFKILHVQPSGNACTLELPDTCKFHNVINAGYLRPYIERAFQPAQQPPPSILQRRIDKIVSARLRYNRMAYVVQWQGLGPAWNTSCPAAWLQQHQDGPAAIQAWEQRQASIPATPAQDRAAPHRPRPRPRSRFHPPPPPPQIYWAPPWPYFPWLQH